MPKQKQEEERKVPDEFVANIVKLSEFLDPHLDDSSEAGKLTSQERWSLRRAAIFILGASLILWGIIIALIQHVHRFMALRGRN